MTVNFATLDGSTSDDATSFISITADQVIGQCCALCVGISQATNAATVQSVADSSNSVWTFRAGITNSTGAVRAEIWTCNSMLGNAVTVTVTLTLAADARGNFLYYNGVAGIGTTNTSTGSSAIPSISLTTQDWNNLIVGTIAYQNATSKTFGQLTGTSRTLFDPTGTFLIGNGSGDNQSINPQSLTYATSLASSDDWAAVAVELRSVITPTASISWITA